MENENNNSTPQPSQSVSPVPPANMQPQPVLPSTQPAPIVNGNQLSSEAPLAQQPAPNIEQPKKLKRPILLILVGVVLLVVIIAVGILVMKKPATNNKNAAASTSNHSTQETFTQNGPSMTPTIGNGQRVKVATGYSDPKIGDIVLFNLPNPGEFGQPSGTKTLRRVVAIGGDRVEIANNKLTVIDSAHPNGFSPDESDGLSNEVTSGSQQNNSIDIPSGNVFVLGDNRPVSLDSREYGPVLVTQIIGKVVSY